jgi:cytochrome c-type biogenesis protein CcmH
MRVLAALLLLAMASIVVPAVTAPPASAVEPNEVLKDPALERRAREISKRLRCLVCQNQSIDDSNAGLARDLRVLVRERLTAGDSDAAVIRFVVARYGDFVLLRPPVKPATYVLWFGPLLILLVAGAGAFVFIRRRRPGAATAAAKPLSTAEQKRLDALLADDGSGP